MKFKEEPQSTKDLGGFKRSQKKETINTNITKVNFKYGIWGNTKAFVKDNVDPNDKRFASYGNEDALQEKKTKKGFFNGFKNMLGFGKKKKENEHNKDVTSKSNLVPDFNTLAGKNFNHI